MQIIHSGKCPRVVTLQRSGKQWETFSRCSQPNASLCTTTFWRHFDDISSHIKFFFAINKVLLFECSREMIYYTALQHVRWKLKIFQHKYFTALVRDWLLIWVFHRSCAPLQPLAQRSPLPCETSCVTSEASAKLDLISDNKTAWKKEES